MLGELEALGLVVGAEVAAVENFRNLGHALVDQSPHDLPILQEERHLVAPDLQHGLGPDAARRRMAETAIEEAR
jgi:hypothetical protein